MSNCVDIKYPDMILTPQVCKTKELYEALRGHDEHPKDINWSTATEEEKRQYMIAYNAHWFLSPGKNVVLAANGELAIRWGFARSSHCFRDLRTSIRVIAMYMKEWQQWPTVMQDAENPGWFRASLVFDPAKALANEPYEEII